MFPLLSKGVLYLVASLQTLAISVLTTSDATLFAAFTEMLFSSKILENHGGTKGLCAVGIETTGKVVLEDAEDLDSSGRGRIA